MKKSAIKLLAMALAVIMLVGVVPVYAFAASIDYDTDRDDDYYKLISKKDWELAPGITESEIVLNNAASTHRQVAHVVEVDLNNPYTKVIPSTYKMAEGLKNKDYKVQIMSEQAAYAEANGYGNVVAAMNISLSWYDSAYYNNHPELVGEPLGYLVLDGELYKNSQGQTAGAQTCLVINFDEKDGVARPADMPKVQLRSTGEAITGWEEQVIPANFGFLVKDGKNQSSKNHTSDPASRSFMGIKEDGTFVMVMNDGRQSPYSAGFNSYEMAEFMLSLGCVYAVNGDGGGSSAFLSQRPGEELKVNCSPSDGAERPTTHGILVISTAPATGEFEQAHISAPDVYYTPGSSIQFSAIGTDLVGNAADIPEDVAWQLADPTMGTIKDGLFVSSGKVGTATAQMVYDGEIVGEGSVEIVIPDAFSFSQAIMTVPFGKEVVIGLNATINGGLNNVVLKGSDVIFSTTNSALGTFDGLKFTSVSEENAPADLKSTLTATLVHGNLTATAALNLGKGSEILFDFEDENDADDWNIADVNGNDAGFYQHLSIANPSNGMVHDGNGSLRVEMNPISAPGISNGGYAQSDLFLDEGVVVENAKSIGFWAYIPDEYVHCWIRVLYWYDSNNDGIFDKKNTITVINQPEVYNTFDESGWRYFSVDVSAYSKILIPGLDCKERIAYNASKNDANNFRFIEFMFPHTNTNDLWKTYGTVNGLQTVYVDNITADFSDAVDDREAPIFQKVEIAVADKAEPLVKRVPFTVTDNALSLVATVTENTAKTNATGLNAASAKAYVDGVEVDVTYSNGRISFAKDVVVADGFHRVKFEISDNAGNTSVIIRYVIVNSGVDASTVQLVPADPALNNLYGGSIYWMNLNATDIETIQSVTTTIDLNYGNHWELDHMVLADGFTADYSIDVENNTATITVTRTGKNTQTGAATLAALPIRVIYYDTDIHVEGFDAKKFWDEYGFWPYDLKADVDMGAITYVDGYESAVLGAFSNEEFSVDTELQTAFSDPAFKAERGTAHVHTPSAVADLAPTCTKDGYTGRTYCAVCDSVVEWGKVPALGHNYKVTGDKLVCDCGDEYTGTGLIDVNGTTYYTINGELRHSWIELDDGWYYFNPRTYAGPNGKHTTLDGITFVFENGRLTTGVWEQVPAGMRYWYGPAFYRDQTNDATSSRPYVIDGKTYLFNRAGIMQTGIVNSFVADGTLYYDCGTDGVATLLNGVYKDQLYIDGVRQVRYRLVAYNDDIYFVNDGDKILKNARVYLGNAYVAGKTFPDGRAIQPGYYTFDAEGKMVIEPLKNGVVGDYLYINDVKQTRYKLVAFEGAYYFINDGDKIVKNMRLYLSATYVNGKTFPDGRAILPGYYSFDAEGKMIIDPLKDGVVGDYLYINDVKQTRYKLVEHDGNLYFINDGDKIAKNMKLYLSATYVSGKTFPDGRAIVPGYYNFDAEGKMVIPEPKHGVVDGYLYINDVKQTRYKLVEFEGNFYFINDGDKIAKNTRLYLSATYVSGKFFSDGRAIAPGFYNFDAEGKMIVEPLKNGVIGDYLYINDVKQTRYKLVEFEGDYYFINDGDKIAKNTRLYLNAGFVAGTSIPAGYYRFDANGKLILE